MKQHLLLPLLGATVAASLGCGGDGGRFATNNCGDFPTANCVEVEGGDSAALQTAVNALVDDTTIILGPGTFELDNQVTIRNADGVNLVGQGIGETTLSFGTATSQINGVDVVGDDFLVQDLTVLDAPKDGIRVELSDGVTFRRIETTWTTPGASTNGAYGIYPVRVSRVLVEDSIASNASDAGLYVGQCQHAIVRRNRVEGNVAGLEIENTQYADVYENHAEDNTAGIVVFDLPGNPVVGRDVHFHDNVIINNNRRNFAPGGTVAVFPAGTGTVALASRRVIIENNRYENNRTADIGVLSGLALESDEAQWELDSTMLVGDHMDLGLAAGATMGTVTNFRSVDIIVRGNTHMGSGTRPDISKDFGLLISALFGNMVPSVVYDSIGESNIDYMDASMHSNDNNICVGGNTGGSFTSADFEGNADGPPFVGTLIVNSAPFGAFDCDSFTPALVAPTL